MEQLKSMLDSLLLSGVELGKNIIAAVIVYIIGRYVIKLINKLITKVLDKKDIDPAVKSFLKSMTNILLMILLIIAVISTLGVETTSFAALLASAGVAIGMALSGNLQNFAGGLIVLLFKPYRIGDYIETEQTSGTVQEIQIFHTILTTPDNKTIYIPNGLMSSRTLINYSKQLIRRVEWTIGVDYGTDVTKIRALLEKILKEDNRVLEDPAYTISVGTLADSSVSIVVRAWVGKDDYWDVFYGINEHIYDGFNEAGISFPFPQITVHNA